MTHEDLKNIRRKRQHVNTLKERIDRLRFGAEYPLRRLGELCSVSNDVRDKLAEDVAKIVDLEHELALEVLALDAAASKIEREFGAMSDVQRSVISEYYLIGARDWTAVARKTQYNYKRVLRARDAAYIMLGCEC